MFRFNLFTPLGLLCIFTTACTSNTPIPVDCQRQSSQIRTKQYGRDPSKQVDNKLQGTSSSSRSDSRLADVETIEVIMLESMPAQVNIEVKGFLPNACYRVGKVYNTRDNKHFFVTISLQALQTYLPCTELAVPFSTTVSLDVQGLETGGHCVDVNGVASSFELSADN